MLGRRPSIGPLGNMGPNTASTVNTVTGGGGGPGLLSLDHPMSMYHATPTATTTADYGPSDEIQEGSDIVWINHNLTRGFLRSLALLSLLSVMLNTPKSFEIYPPLIYITYVVDLVCVGAFTAEMVLKIIHKGLWTTSSTLEATNDDNKMPFLKDRWCQFDASMLFFIVVSVLLQTLEIVGIVHPYSPLHMLRAPRPLIMIRSKSLKLFNKLSSVKGVDWEHILPPLQALKSYN